MKFEETEIRILDRYDENDIDANKHSVREIKIEIDKYRQKETDINVWLVLQKCSPP